jgi:hypothetical protein
MYLGNGLAPEAEIPWYVYWSDGGREVGTVMDDVVHRRALMVFGVVRQALDAEVWG